MALVTGASRGIGAACATRLADAGWDVGLTYAADAEGCEATAAAVRERGRRAAVVHAEAREPETLAAAVRDVEDALGPLDALVVNAGTTRDGLAVRMSADDWRAPIEVNLEGTAHTVRAAAGGMVARGGGSVVALTSVVGVHGNAGQANYAAAKAGIIGLTKSLAKELGARGVRVNAIAPGYIDTPMTQALPEETRQMIVDATPLKSIGTADDVASAVVYLASPAARFVTGVVLPVDGGLGI